MMRQRMRAGLTAMAVGASVGVAAVAAPAGASAQVPAPVTLAGSLATGVTSGTDAGVVAGSQPQTIEVWLTPNSAGAQALVNAVSTPGSSSYHRYLSPGEYTQRFAAGPAAARAVSAWLSAQGMSDVVVSPGRDYVSATATTATVNRAFAVQMHRYTVAGTDGATTTIQSNDRPLSVPASLAHDIVSVTGLNSTRPTPLDVSGPAGSATTPCSSYWGQHTATVSPAYDGFTSAGTPVCGYSADQVRAAYGQTMANTGTGQTIALIEQGTPTAMGRTLADYAHANGLPAPAPGQFREEQLAKRPGCDNFYDGEEQLDSESAYAMAPGADQLMVDGNSCNPTGAQPLYNAQLAPLIGDDGHPSATIESNSFVFGAGESSPPSELATEHLILLRAAAEGVGMYFASGDYGGVQLPASDPDATAVGGTTLGIGAQNERLFETGWSDDVGALVNGAWQDLGIQDGAGGGDSSIYDEPAYQRGVVPSSMSDAGGRQARTVPDIAADADGDTGMLIGTIEPTANGTPGPYTASANGGTSMATPLVAGMVADAQQGQPTSFGFINPLLYSLAGTAAFNDVLPLSPSLPQTDRNAFTTATIDTGYGAPTDTVFDVQDEAAGQVTAPGYDTMTGLGTPDGQAFIAALRSGGETDTQTPTP